MGIHGMVLLAHICHFLLCSCSSPLTRLHAYTCWNTSSGARVNNYGSRIDHILVADGGAGSSSSSSGRGGGGGQVAGCPPWVVAAVS